MHDRPRILIADDEDAILTLLRAVLEEQGYEVLSVLSGEQALEVIENDPDIDIILLDIMMPGLDGFDVLERLKEDPRTANICVIMLTAAGQVNDKVKAFSTGASDYLVKPFKMPELLSRIEIHLKIIHTERELQKAHDGLEKRVQERTAELAAVNKKLVEADEIKNEFISILAHDLGTPMAVMIGHLQLLSKGIYGELTERQKINVQKILNNARRLNKLRADTLDISRIDRGTFDLEKEVLLISVLLQEAVDDMRELAAEKQQQIALDLPDLGIVNCDGNRIRQVLDNYISNAIRYTGEGGKIAVGGEVNKKEVRIWVKDNGRGIPPEELHKVYKRFYRTGDKVEGSSGLGLAIVKGIIGTHGGRAWCESEGDGKGTTFFFTLPRK